MAPQLPGQALGHLHTRAVNTTSPETVTNYLYVQWYNPSDILSLLLIVGPEVVKNAVAQLNGRVVTPIAFSFGWVAYAVSALLSTVGDGRLMPDGATANIHVIGAASGHVRTTNSWVLTRLLHDWDDRLDKEMSDEAPQVPPGQQGNPSQASSAPAKGQAQKQKQKAWEALRVSVYEIDKRPPCAHGVPILDRVWFSGVVVIPVQLGISIIPWIIHNDWSAFLITASGTIMAIIGGSLPQWKEEKWACPKNGGATVTLTRGNGSRHAVVIKGSKNIGLDLEILAQGTRTSRASIYTRAATGLLALFWILFLITVSGIKTNTWYILAVGLLGSMQNIFVAAAPRNSSGHGVHLRLLETIRAPRVAQVLMELEQKHPSVGTSLLRVFFPGGLRAKGDDLAFWRGAMSTRFSPNQYGTRIDLMPTLTADLKKDKRSSVTQTG